MIGEKPVEEAWVVKLSQSDCPKALKENTFEFIWYNYDAHPKVTISNINIGFEYKKIYS